MAGSYAPDDGEPETDAAPATVVRRLDDGGPELERRATGDRALDRAIGGGIPEGSTVTVYGPRGAGKSTLCLRWLSRLSPRALVVCPEMSPGILLATARRSGARLEHLRRVEEPDQWHAAALEHSSGAVLYDSISRARAPLTTLRALIDWAQQTSGIALALAHRGKKGSAKGPTELEHDPDAVWQVRPRAKGRVAVVIEKSRFSPLGTVELSLSVQPKK